MQPGLYANEINKSSFRTTSTIEVVADAVPVANAMVHIKDIPYAEERWAKAIAFVRKYVSG